MITSALDICVCECFDSGWDEGKHIPNGDCGLMYLMYRYKMGGLETEVLPPFPQLVIASSILPYKIIMKVKGQSRLILCI